MDEQLEAYIGAHISPEPQHLERLYRHTQVHNLYPRMCSGHLQGRLLAMLASMIKPRTAVELGTFTGYSALCLAEGMGPGTTLHTIEINDEMEDSLLATFAGAPGERADIVLHTGDALELLPRLDVGPIDLLFIDANKRLYTEYIEAALPKMRPGGFIIADNTLWDGKIAHAGEHVDAQTAGIMRFNDYVAAHPRLAVAIVPIRDGLTLIRVKDE